MLYRGDYEIPWGCQFKPYDPYEKAILGAAGKVIHGRQGRPQDRALFGGYDFFLFHPEDAAMSWNAFHSLPELQQFLDAYGLTLTTAPAPGESFTVSVPDAPRMAPLRHIAMEVLKDDGGLSLRVAKLADEPHCFEVTGERRARRLMAIELWDGDRQVASFSPFTVSAPPSILPDPDQMTDAEMELAIAVLVGSLPWGERWTALGAPADIVVRAAALAESLRAAEPSPRPRG
jgi:hypothetical protein